ncbi:hypothetical protein [Dactylosporangium sp. NPDC050588]|uniref:hypothetical protein n=1 Tax=Dactylosporangium sp. NPDC050588 TaxID=3157211 RepID=UPI0033C67B71
MLDRAIGVHGSLVARNVARARQRNPDATPAQVIRNLERMYVSALAGTGAAVGGAATAPGVGTGIGGGANAAVAGLAARAARRAFGPPPEVWTYEGEVVDVVDAP